MTGMDPPGSRKCSAPVPAVDPASVPAAAGPPGRYRSQPCGGMVRQQFHPPSRFSPRSRDVRLDPLDVRGHESTKHCQGARTPPQLTFRGCPCIARQTPRRSAGSPAPVQGQCPDRGQDHRRRITTTSTRLKVVPNKLQFQAKVGSSQVDNPTAAPPGSHAPMARFR